jgi:hypothetical protein
LLETLQLVVVVAAALRKLLWWMVDRAAVAVME